VLGLAPLMRLLAFRAQSPPRPALNKETVAEINHFRHRDIHFRTRLQDECATPPRACRLNKTTRWSHRIRSRKY
jgi:hypothetical protein